MIPLTVVPASGLRRNDEHGLQQHNWVERNALEVRRHVTATTARERLAYADR